MLEFADIARPIIALQCGYGFRTYVGHLFVEMRGHVFHEVDS